MRILAIVGAVLLGALLIGLGAFGARWFADPAAPSPEPVAVAAPSSRLSAGAPPDSLNLGALRELLQVVDRNRRAAILQSPEAFEQFVAQETLNQSVLTAAYANGANEVQAIQVLMRRAGDRVLAETYLNQVIRTNLDPDFPSGDQVREAYDNNPDAFRVPERLHLWQIFIPLAADADEADVASAWKRADSLAGQLRAGKGDFAALAKEHSAHEPSRVNDGYMGLVKVQDLLPAIAEATEGLKMGEVSEPIATEAGLHIVRRGARVEPEVFDFEKIKGEVRQRLRRDAEIRVRQAAIEKIAEEFPVSAPESDLEAWREQLRAGFEPAGRDATAGDGGDG